jgi:hypothetical protein
LISWAHFRAREEKRMEGEKRTKEMGDRGRRVETKREER